MTHTLVKKTSSELAEFKNPSLAGRRIQTSRHEWKAQHLCVGTQMGGVVWLRCLFLPIGQQNSLLTCTPGKGVETLCHSLLEIKLEAMPQVSSFGVECRWIE